MGFCPLAVSEPLFWAITGVTTIDESAVRARIFAANFLVLDIATPRSVKGIA